MRRIRNVILGTILALGLSVSDYVHAGDNVATTEMSVNDAKERVRNNPNSSNYEALSEAYAKEKDWENVEKTTKEAVDNNLATPFIYNNLAVSLSRQKRFSEAREMYQKGLDLNNQLDEDKRDMRIHTNFGAFLYKQGKCPEALNQITIALQIDPNYKNAILGKKLILNKLSQQ